jgi:hypothetical protein
MASRDRETQAKGGPMIVFLNLWLASKKTGANLGYQATGFRLRLKRAMNHQAQANTPNADPDILRAQLKHVMDYDNNTNDVIWALFGIFFAVNSVLLVALFQSGDFPKPPAGTIISLAGALMSLVGALFHRRVLAHKERFEALIRRIEEDLNIPVEYRTSRKTNKEDWQKYMEGKGPGARPLLSASTWGSFAMWLAALLTFLCMWYHRG